MKYSPHHIRPHQVTRDFEAALCDYTGARYAVTVTSCTAALLLALIWNRAKGQVISLPRRTYCSVPMQVVHAGAQLRFLDEKWRGAYQLRPLPVYDCARRFTSGMYQPGTFQCVSFHWRKILGIQQGGAILHDSAEADEWLRRARFDGRTEGVNPKEDAFIIGHHCYMSPEVAAEGLMRLSILPAHNDDLPNDDYPDLAMQECFQPYIKKDTTP